MNCEFKLVSSLEKSFLDRPENMRSISDRLTAAGNAISIMRQK